MFRITSDKLGKASHMRVGLVQLTVIRYSQTVSNKVSFQSVARREESRSLVAPRLVNPSPFTPLVLAAPQSRGSR